MYQEIEEMRKFYNCLSDTCFFLIPTGAPDPERYLGFLLVCVCSAEASQR